MPEYIDGKKDIKFVDGLIVKAPHEKAPDFVKCAISIKRSELISWLTLQEGDWINLDVKESRAGKWYAAVNDFKPESRQDAAARQNNPTYGGSAGQTPDPDFDQDIPF